MLSERLVSVGIRNKKLNWCTFHFVITPKLCILAEQPQRHKVHKDEFFTITTLSYFIDRCHLGITVGWDELLSNSSYSPESLYFRARFEGSTIAKNRLFTHSWQIWALMRGLKPNISPICLLVGSRRVRSLMQVLLLHWSIFGERTMPIDWSCGLNAMPLWWAQLGNVSEDSRCLG